MAVSKEEALQELYRRGALKGRQKAAYEEAARRGLVGNEARALADARARVGKSTNGQMRAFTQGVSLGFADELDAFGAGLETAVGNIGRSVMGKELPYTPQQAEAAVLQANREADNQFRQEHPVQSIGLNIAGGVFTPGAGAAGRFVTAGRTLPAVIGRSAAVGAATGAVGGAGSAEGGYADRLAGAASGAAVGGALGSALPVAGRVAQAVGNRVGGRQAAPAVPVDTLRTQTRQAYDAVDQAGVQYSDSGFDRMVDDIDATLKSELLSPMRHPKAASMIADLQGLKGSGMSLPQLDQIRQVVRRDVANASDPADARLGQMIISRIDDFIDNAQAGDLTAGNGPNAAGLVRDARASNTRLRKMESVDDAQERARLRAGATGSGGNINNATRQELRRVYEGGNNWTPEESQAFERAIIGTPGQNALRLAGKLSPQGNGLMAAGNLGAAAAAGPIGAVPGAVGIAAKALADAATARNVNELRRLISTGSPAVRQALQLDPRLAEIVSRVALSADREIASEAAPPAVFVESIGDQQFDPYGQPVTYADRLGR